MSALYSAPLGMLNSICKKHRSRQASQGNRTPILIAFQVSDGLPFLTFEEHPFLRVCSVFFNIKTMQLE
jgi:hypothetical protein